MKKTQLKTLATQIHGLAVKSASGKKPAQNKALEKITTLLNQAIEGEVKQAYAGIASQVRGLAEKLEQLPDALGHGQHAALGLLPVGAALAIDGQASLLP